MRTWVKICGNTNLADTQAAVEAGADAVGFIFCESPRRTDVATARAISVVLPNEVEKVGIFVNESADAVIETAREAGLTGVQLHGDESPEYVKSLLRMVAGMKLKIIKSIPATLGRSSGLGYFDGGENFVDAIMVDSGPANLRGGTGQVFDWLRAGDFIMWLEQRVKVIVAGGLNPDNVAAAISLFHPAGVDVVTGVEASYGKKDLGKVRAFISAVRAAERPALPAKILSRGEKRR
jgi:phosphoribosylanthranilate isomerase